MGAGAGAGAGEGVGEGAGAGAGEGDVGVALSFGRDELSLHASVPTSSTAVTIPTAHLRSVSMR